MRFTLSIRAKICVVGALWIALPLSAQRSVAATDIVASDLSFEAFGRDQGLRSRSVYTTFLTADRTLWIGTDIGPMRYDGLRFVLMPLPADVTQPQVRAFLQESTGGLLMATHSGVFERVGNVWRPFGVTAGLPRGRAWSMVERRKTDGVRELVVAVDAGVHVGTRSRFEQVLAPDGTPTSMAMLAVTHDGTRDRVWIATLTRGLFSLDDKTILRAETSLNDSALEDVRSCPALGPSAAVVAGQRGVWLTENGSSWRRILTLTRVTRATCARVSAGADVWAGTWDSRIIRRRADSRMEELTQFSRAGLPTQALDAINDGMLSTSAVYLALRGASLTRVRTDGAGTIDNSQLVIGSDVQEAIETKPDALGRRHLFAITPGDSMVDVFGAANARRPRTPAVHELLQLRDGRMVGLMRARVTVFNGASWVPLVEPSRSDTVSHIVRVRDARGEQLVALAGDTLFVATTTPFVSWRALSAAPRAASQLVWDSAGQSLILAYRDRVMRVPQAGGAARTSVSPANGVSSVTVATTPNGASMLVIATPRGLTIGASDATAAGFHDWTGRELPVLMNANINTVRGASAGRLLLASQQGITALRLQNDARLAPIVLAKFDDSDGIPRGQITGITIAPSNDRAWISTSAGLGQIPLRDSASPAPVGSLTITLKHQSGDTALVTDGEQIPFGRRNLRADFRLQTFHREDESRFRVELEGSADTASLWTPDTDREFAALASGSYTLRVWARDWLGRDVGPQSIRFTLLPPFWRSPLAIGAYVLLGIGAFAAGVRLRGRKVIARARGAEAEALRVITSEERFRRLFEGGADSQLLVDGARVVAANPVAFQLLAVGHENELVGINTVLVTAEPDPDPASDAVSYETTVTTLDGVTIPVELRRTRIPLEQGDILHYRIRDLRKTKQLESERKQLEAQLLASQRLEALGTLAGGVAHDFNNLLTVIRANSEIAQVSMADHDPEGVAESLSAVLQASDRARDIVKQILLFSRRSVPVHARINLAAMITDTQLLLRATIPSTVQLLVEVRAADAWINGDATQMQQLLLNLCNNAEYSMRQTNGGMLRLSVDTVTVSEDRSTKHPQVDPGQYVRLLVRDTGEGMSAEVRERIFEPFFTTKPVGEGTGLGMAVLHGIVQSHHGSVHVDSIEGRGTHFELLFGMLSPPEQSAASMQATPPYSTAIITPRHRTAVTTDAPLILLVDDEPGILRAAERGIIGAGMRVLTAPSGGVALKLLEVYEDIALLITDQTMPGMTGIALAEQVRVTRPVLPIILSTGFTGRVSPERLAAAQIHTVLDKPYTLTELTDAIHDALRAARRERMSQPA